VLRPIVAAQVAVAELPDLVIDAAQVHALKHSPRPSTEGRQQHSGHQHGEQGDAKPE